MNAKNTPSKPAPLGRGLSALFGDADASYKPRTQPQQPAAKPAVSGAIKGDVFRELDVYSLVESSLQSRRHFDEESIAELAESITRSGIIQPIIVRVFHGEMDNMYEVVAGERRWRAAQKAGLHKIPAIVRTLSNQEALELNIIENVQRQDLTPIEEAEGYNHLLEHFGYTQEKLSEVIGKSRPHISNTLRLMKLPEKVKNMLLEGKLGMAHARAIVTAKDPTALAEQIVKRKLSARQAEALAQKESDGRFAKKARLSSSNDPNIAALEQELSASLGLKIKVTVLTASSGTMTLHYSSIDQFEDVIRKLQT